MILGRFDIALLGALAFAIVGFGRGDSWFFFWGPPGWVQALLWLTFVGGVIMLIAVVANQQSSRPRPRATAVRRRSPRRRSPPQAPAFTPPATTYRRGHAHVLGERPRRRTVLDPRACPRPRPPHRPGPRTHPRPRHPPLARHRRPARSPRRSRPVPARPVPGAGTVGVVVALSLLTLAVLLIAERQGDFTGPVALTALRRRHRAGRPRDHRLRPARPDQRWPRRPGRRRHPRRGPGRRGPEHHLELVLRRAAGLRHRRDGPGRRPSGGRGRVLHGLRRRDHRPRRRADDRPARSRCRSRWPPAT